MSADVTVIIPMFNSSNTIERALKSVLNQTELPKEVIVVDDCSSDNSVNVAHGYLSKHRGLISFNIVCLENNKGPGNARNVGVELARGKYVAFLDADDSWCRGKIELQYQFMIRNPWCALSGHEKLVVDGDVDESYYKDRRVDFEYDRIRLKQLLLRNRFSTPTVMVCREDVLFSSEGRFSEDYLAWLNVLRRRDGAYLKVPLAIIHKPLYGASGLSSNVLKMQMGEHKNYLHMYNEGVVSLIGLIGLLLFSWAKFIRRILIAMRDKVVNKLT